MGKKILIVDDEEILCDLLAETLEAEGYDVMKIYDGQMAIDPLSLQKFDLAIIDLYLPKKSGIEILKFIHDNDIKTSVIMASGYSEIPVATEAMKLGARDFLLKPFNLNLLKQALERIFNPIFPADFSNIPGNEIPKSNNANLNVIKSDYDKKTLLEEPRSATVSEEHKIGSGIFNEKELMEVILKEMNGNKSKTAEKLGISLKTLHTKMNEYGIEN
jgi:DNA-binding NtrC family response regulator